MANEMNWKKAIEKVLKDAGAPMHYGDIAEAIVSNGLKSKVGATPGNSVVATIATSKKNDGEATPFFRVAVGMYTLKSLVDSEGQGEPDKDQESIEEETGGIKAYGAYWSRNLIRWGKPTLLGQQQIGADPVDLSSQIGVYLLYDGREVIYVGQATDSPILTRLRKHTKDRLRARWDRFSWFGLYPVSTKGKVIEDQPTVEDSGSLIRTLEAVLIESMEPRQNRRGGDHFADIEYIQVEDPSIAKDKMRKMFDDYLD